MKQWMAALTGVLLVSLTGCGVTESIGNVAKKITPSFKGSKTPDIPEEEYEFVIEVAGMRRSKGRSVRTGTTYRDRPAIETRTTQTTTVVRDGQTFTTDTSRQAITDVDGAAFYMYEKTVKSGLRTEQTVMVVDGRATFESWGDEGSDRREIEVPRDVIFSIEPYWLSRQNLRIGGILEAKSLSFFRKAVLTDRAEIVDHRPVIFRGSQQPAWVARVTYGSNPDNPVTILFTAEGELIESRTDTAVFRVLDSDTGLAAGSPDPDYTGTAGDVGTSYREEIGLSAAPIATEPLNIISTVKLDFPIPAWDTFDRIGLGLSPAAQWQTYLHAGEYMDIGPVAGDRIDVTLRKVAPSVPRMAVFPIRETPADMRDFLVASDHIMSDKPEIRKIAQGITAGQDDALAAVALLAGWVYQEIRWNTRDQLNQSPLQTLRSRRGDCSEHADLFSSLARAMGIPTRHCAGLLVQKDTAVYHVWVEVNLAGVWVPVDTTVSRVGLPAGYLLTWRDLEGRGQLRDTFPRALLDRSLSVKVMSLTRGGHTVNPDDKYSYVSKDDAKGTLANHYYGYALTKPDGWEGSIFLKMIKLVSPDKAATVYVEALPEQVDPTESTINALLATLQKSLTGFSKVSGDIQPYGAVTKMIRLEFLCTVEGKPMRCVQYVIPRRGRSYRLSCWSPANAMETYQPIFAQVLDSLKI